MVSQNEVTIALALLKEGRVRAAEAIFKDVLIKNPKDHSALHFLGIIKFADNEVSLALKLLKKSVDIAPSAPYLTNLGECLFQIGDHAGAMSKAAAALEIIPDFITAKNLKGKALDALFNEVILLVEQDKLMEAFERIDLLLSYQPTELRVLNCKAAVLFRLKRFSEALSIYEILISRYKGFPEFVFGKASCQLALGDLRAAIAEFNLCISLGGESAEVFSNRGSAHLDAGMFDEAEHDFNRAVDLDPALPSPHLNRSLVWLARQEWKKGFREYEWGWKAGRRGPLKFSKMPRWRGESIEDGKTILIHDEQGLGDVIQFSRFLSVLSSRNISFSFAVRPVLHPLISLSFRDCKVVSDELVTEEQYDFACALLTLPSILGVSSEDLAGFIPYIFCDPARRAKFKKFCSGSFNIGLCSQGSKGTDVDSGRSFPIHFYAPLLKLPRVRLFSLHKSVNSNLELGPLKGFLEELPAWADADGAFMDTAALIKSMDLIITTDTAVAHLAGAMGVNVWVILKKFADWRWGIDQVDCPWYPTMRLFRQHTAGSWVEVLEDVEVALKALLVE